MPQIRRGRATTEDATDHEGSGWDAVAKKKAANEEARKDAGNRLYDVSIKDGESAYIQFLEEDPVCLDTHQVKIDGKWRTIPCQKASKRSCTLCDDGIKTTWRAAFLVLDYRGEWDKDKGRFKNLDKNKRQTFPLKNPVERRLLASNTLALQIKAVKEKKGTITKFVYELSRTGSTAKDTSYAMSQAMDDEDELIRAKAWDAKADLEAACKPPTDEILARMGYDGSYHGDDNEKPEPPVRGARKSRRGSDDDE